MIEERFTKLFGKSHVRRVSTGKLGTRNPRLYGISCPNFFHYLMIFICFSQRLRHDHEKSSNMVKNLAENEENPCSQVALNKLLHGTSITEKPECQVPVSPLDDVL